MYDTEILAARKKRSVGAPILLKKLINGNKLLKRVNGIAGWRATVVFVLCLNARDRLCVVFMNQAHDCYLSTVVAQNDRSFVPNEVYIYTSVTKNPSGNRELVALSQSFAAYLSRSFFGR